MELMAPAGPVYQAGTLSGNPLAMAAGIATLKGLRQPGLWAQLEASSEELVAGIGAAAKRSGTALQQHRVGTMFSAFFSDRPVYDYATAAKSNTDRFARYFNVMLENGVYLAPSQFEAGFMSSAHGPSEIERTIKAAEKAFASL